jgi:hypothetical protein
MIVCDTADPIPKLGTSVTGVNSVIIPAKVVKIGLLRPALMTIIDMCSMSCVARIALVVDGPVETNRYQIGAGIWQIDTRLNNSAP